MNKMKCQWLARPAAVLIRKLGLPSASSIACAASMLGMLSAPAATVNVSNVMQLVTAVNGGAAGNTINVAAGTYVLTASLTPKPSMVIQGAGSTNTILQPAVSWNPGTNGLPEDPVGINSADPTTYMFNLGGNDGIKISGMTLDGLQQLHGGILITYDGKNHEFYNLELRNYFVAGIRGFNIQSSSIHDNTIVMPVFGHWEFSACVFLAWPYDMQIYNNRISGKCFGIKLRQDVRSHIYNNTILNEGFAIEAPFDNNEDSEYDHNLFKSPVSIPKEGGGDLPVSGKQNRIHHNYFMPAYAIEFARDGVEIDHNLFDLMAAGWEDGRLISSWCAGDGPCNMHDNLIKDPGYGLFFSTGPYNNFHFYNNHVIANSTPLRHTGGLFDLNGGSTFSTIWIKDNIIDCTTLARPLSVNPASVIQNNTLINVSDAGRYANSNTGAKRGPLAPLNFTCGVNGEYTVNQWSITFTDGGAPVPPIPTKPAHLAASGVSSSQINLTWTDLATNETGFKIERWIGSDYAPIATVGANVTRYANTGLPADNQQWYRIRAYNATGDGPYSNEIDGRTQGTGAQSPYGGIARAVPGTIQAEDFDTGGEGVAYHDTDTANNGGQYRANERVGIESCSDTGGGYNIGYIANGEWLEYTVSVTPGTYNITFRVASESTGGQIRALLDGNDLGAVTVPVTGGWQNWTDVKLTGKILTGGNGKLLRLEFPAAGFNLNKIVITTAGSLLPLLPERTPDGQFKVTATVVQGLTCEWQVSSNLQIWTPVLTNTAASSGPLALTEDINDQIDCRFYRVRYR